MNIMHEYAKSANNAGRMKKFDSFLDGEDGEYTGVSFTDISKLFLMQNKFINVLESFDEV